MIQGIAKGLFSTDAWGLQKKMGIVQHGGWEARVRINTSWISTVAGS
jgi:hypothetical protein